MYSVFDSIAAKYDQWYDTAEGGSIFRAELDCLRAACPACAGRWVDVGVGTGRFASALGIVPADSPWGRAYIEKSGHGHASASRQGDPQPAR